MKKLFSFAGTVCYGLMLILLNGCVKDKVTRTYTYTIQRPIYQTLTQARAAIKGGESVAIQSPGKISLYKNHIFLNEASKGIHVIDNTDPSNPRNVSFINIPGNTDLSIKNDILYANEAYGDLVVIDIRNPEKPVVRKYLPNIFNMFYGYAPYPSALSSNPDSIQVITGWISKDTTIHTDPNNPGPVYYNTGTACANCDFFSLSSNATPNAANIQGPNTIGTNGSTSAFAISGQNLYALSYNSQLNVVDIAAVDDPQLANQLPLGQFSETIFPFENNLFIGTNSGMLIYDLSDPSTPVKKGSFAHITACDPVITDGQYAYVTLRSGTTCQATAVSQLDIVSVSDLSNPSLLKTYPLTNPSGLSKDGDLLFICDGKSGLKIYDASNVTQLSLIKTIGGIETSEVIAQNGKAIVIATDGLYQFDYSDTNNIHQISKIDTHAAGL